MLHLENGRQYFRNLKKGKEKNNKYKEVFAVKYLIEN